MNASRRRDYSLPLVLYSEKQSRTGLRSPSGAVNGHVGATFGIARPPNRHHRPVRHAGGHLLRSHRGNDADKRHQERRPAYRKHDLPSAVPTDGNVP